MNDVTSADVRVSRLCPVGRMYGFWARLPVRQRQRSIKTARAGTRILISIRRAKLCKVIGVNVSRGWLRVGVLVLGTGEDPLYYSR